MQYWKNVPKLSKYRVSYYSNVIFKLFGGYLSFSKNRRVSRKWFHFVQVIQHITSLPPKMNVRKVKLLHFIPPGNRLSKNIINFFSKVSKNLTIHSGDNFVKSFDADFFPNVICKVSEILDPNIQDECLPSHCSHCTKIHSPINPCFNRIHSFIMQKGSKVIFLSWNEYSILESTDTTT